MPSPVKTRRAGGGRKKIRIYKRKGTKKGYSVRNTALDRKRRARKGTAKQRRKYPHHYD